MAGKPGRSGGARPGAGRKPAPKPETVVVVEDDMLALLKNVAQGLIEVTPLQLRAAVAAVQYTHLKSGDGGRKDEAAKLAAEAAARFNSGSASIRRVK